MKILKVAFQAFFLVQVWLLVVNNGGRRVPPGLLYDVCDGQVWKDFVQRKFLRNSNNLVLSLNIDWFQPFTHTPYSVMSCILLYLFYQGLSSISPKMSF